jgi:Phage tail assembly chaperone protein, TAC
VDAFGASALRIGGALARLAGWLPETFWNATPAEAAMVLCAWAAEAGDGALPPDAMLRARLMEQFPDDRPCG